MERLEILLDRARLDLPPADDTGTCGSYVRALDQLAEFSRGSTYRLETTCQCALLFDDVRETKLRFMSWSKNSGVCVSGDTILNLVSGIVGRAGRIEASHCVDGVLFLEGYGEIPRDLPLVNDDERQDLVSLAVISTVDPSNPDSSGEERELRYFITRLPPGVAVNGEITGSALVFRGNQEQPRQFRVTCLFTGDPETFLDMLDPTGVWLSSAGTEEKLVLVVSLTTVQIARANGLRPKYGEWRLGQDFLKLAKHGGYSRRCLTRFWASPVWAMPGPSTRARREGEAE